MTDELSTNLTFSTNLNVGDLTAAAGGSAAYVGFTGATGGSVATQTITNFSFVSIPSQGIQLTATNTVVVTWPGVIAGYVLQQNHKLNTTNWANVTNLDSVVNGQHQVIVPVTSSNAFYRLDLQP
jgi:predicted component of type VI protein secretion system